jgi:hypothetical protein
MAIPEGTGTFTGFPNAPAIDGGDVSVFATGVDGQQGIYRFGRPTPPPIKVADLNTAVPDAPEGVTTFTGFSGAPVIRGDSVAFVGTGTDWQGIYRFVPPNPVRVADLSTPIPNGTGSFTGFIPVDPCIDGSLVVVSGSGSGGQEGVYAVDVALPAPPPIMPIADTSTEIPGGSGNFTGFNPSPPPITPVAPSSSGQYLVFFGAGDEGQQGIYLSDVAFPQPPPILPVADHSDAVQLGRFRRLPLAHRRGGLDGRDLCRPGEGLQAGEHGASEDDAHHLRRAAARDRRAHDPGHQVQQRDDLGPGD